ncbi:NifB/NifX family molybdenum-iron cluster-binding protein [Caproiciproducens sp.]
MKIAVASDDKGRLVTGHFGHCEGFALFETENQQITDRVFVPNPGHKPGFLPNFLNDRGVKVIISGSMGDGAAEIFKEKGIEIFTGVTGETEAAVGSYLNGTLKSSGSVCHEHQHADECGE